MNQHNKETIDWEALGKNLDIPEEDQERLGKMVLALCDGEVHTFDSMKAPCQRREADAILEELQGLGIAGFVRTEGQTSVRAFTDYGNTKVAIGSKLVDGKRLLVVRDDVELDDYTHWELMHHLRS